MFYQERDEKQYFQLRIPQSLLLSLQRPWFFWSFFFWFLIIGKSCQSSEQIRNDEERVETKKNQCDCVTQT